MLFRSEVYDKDFAFLNPGKKLIIPFQATVSDGLTNLTFDIGTLTVYGINNAPVATPDHAAITHEGSLAVSAADGVLANDIDIDTGHVLSVVEAGQFDVDSKPLNPGGSVTLEGSYTTLQIFSDGSYVVHSNGGYPDGTHPWLSGDEAPVEIGRAHV